MLVADKSRYHRQVLSGLRSVVFISLALIGLTLSLAFYRWNTKDDNTALRATSIDFQFAGSPYSFSPPELSSWLSKIGGRSIRVEQDGKQMWIAQGDSKSGNYFGTEETLEKMGAKMIHIDPAPDMKKIHEDRVEAAWEVSGMILAAVFVLSSLASYWVSVWFLKRTLNKLLSFKLAELGWDGTAIESRAALNAYCRFRAVSLYKDSTPVTFYLCLLVCAASFYFIIPLSAIIHALYSIFLSKGAAVEFERKFTAAKSDPVVTAVLAATTIDEISLIAAWIAENQHSPGPSVRPEASNIAA